MRGEFAENNIKRLVTKSGHRITAVDTSGQETLVAATPKSTRLMLTEKADETGRPAIVLYSDGDIILSAPKGRVGMDSYNRNFSVAVLKPVIEFLSVLLKVMAFLVPARSPRQGQAQLCHSFS